jgi:NitT/TauT family transport system ATP-binding protein
MKVEIDNVCKEFVTRSGDLVTALRGVTAEVASGEFVALLGPSGCGKTTLLELVAGLQSQTSGRIIIDGVDVARRPVRPGMVFQAPILLPWRTALENVCLPAEVGARSDRAGRPDAADLKERAASLLATVGLAGFEGKLPNELSGGMQQRVALARALLFDSTLLCMDEPFSALDEFTREQMHLELLALWDKQRFTTLFVTHSVFEAVFLADRVLVMTPRPGKVVADVRIALHRPRFRDMIGSPEFAADVRRIRASMTEYWLQEAETHGH